MSLEGERREERNQEQDGERGRYSEQDGAVVGGHRGGERGQ